eukprot:TRINITY_DN24815_c0_g2_i2.p1 TRINITY_DN24815_c0_g2~~TRINITY_DN24815_c0_g2_i2.p1  ORF type:complete len:116 (-),score=43.94 TRINITY_DN24815_c0_g2_i2:132-479(-)
MLYCLYIFFFFQAEDGIRDAQESRGLGDVYKRQMLHWSTDLGFLTGHESEEMNRAHLSSGMAIGRPFAHEGIYNFRKQHVTKEVKTDAQIMLCLLYTSDAADEEDSVDLGGRRII